jgi:sulfur transfer complex TusBCD TusB component (DsrH family)
MYGYNAMEVQEAFVKIKEQARAYLALPNDLRAGGLRNWMHLSCSMKQLYAVINWLRLVTFEQ